MQSSVTVDVALGERGLLEHRAAGEAGDRGALVDLDPGWALIRSTRYVLMVATSGRRTAMHTVVACSARNMAACPAELPPPTTSTGTPAQARASSSVAA